MKTSLTTLFKIYPGLPEFSILYFCYYGLNVPPPPYPIAYVKILMPDMMVLGGRAFERCLALESGNFMNGINIVLLLKKKKKDSTEPPVHSSMWRYSEKVPSMS